MNQAVIINDDYVYKPKESAWQCSGMLSGEKITIIIYSHILPDALTQSVKFDWEYIIEEWLEDNEPNESVIEIKLT